MFCPDKFSGGTCLVRLWLGVRHRDEPRQAAQTAECSGGCVTDPRLSILLLGSFGIYTANAAVPSSFSVNVSIISLSKYLFHMPFIFHLLFLMLHFLSHSFHSGMPAPVYPLHTSASAKRTDCFLPADGKISYPPPRQAVRIPVPG